MKNRRKKNEFTTDILKQIFKLPPIPTILICVPSFVLVIYVLANNVEDMAISYAAYTLSAYAMMITITGMAGSVFAVTAQPPYIILSIILAVPAFIGWIVPYFLYRRVARKQNEKLTPLVDQKYDEIYEICEKGNKLLY